MRNRQPGSRGRILHLIPTLEGGGAERQLAYLAEGLQADGWEVVVASLRGGVNTDLLRKADIQPRLIKNSSPRDPMLLPRIVRLARDAQPDIIHTWIPSMDILGGLASITLRVPWVASERTQPESWHTGWQMRLRRRLVFGRARVVVTNSQRAAATCVRLGARQERVRFIPNAVPLNSLRDATPVDRAAAGLHTDAKLIVAVGRLDDGKNTEAIVKALPEVLTSVQADVRVFGIGPNRSQLGEQARNLGLKDRVVFEGFSPRVPSWLLAADLFVSASRAEGNPNAVIEAMACETPLVLSDIQEHRELAGGAALYFDPPDVRGLARGVIAALANRESSAERVRLATERVNGMDLPRMITSYRNLYDQILGRR